MASGLPVTTWLNIIGGAYTGWSGLNAVATHHLALANSTWDSSFNVNTEHGWTNTNEISGTGWSTGGRVLSGAAAGGTTNPTFTGTGSGIMTYDMSDISVANTTLTNAAAARFYAQAVTAPTADPVYCVISFGSQYSTSNGTFGITFSGSGVFTIDLG